MKKSIIYLAMALLTVTNGTASTSVMNQSATTTSSGVDTLKNVKASDSFADNNLVNPETIFVRKNAFTAEQLIANDNVLTEAHAVESSALQYPIITPTEVAENNQVIDAVLPAVAPLNFSKINQSTKVKSVEISRPSRFAASL